MSSDALRAFRSLRPHIPAMIAALELNRSRRPTAAAVGSVGLELATRYDPTRRGYVDETAEQLATELGLPIASVLRALPVLDRLGLWTVDRRGGSRARFGSRRSPGPVLCAAAHRLELELATAQTTLDLGTELSALSLSDTPPELSALSLSDTPPELSALSLSDPGTQSDSARNSARYRSTPIGTNIKTTTTARNGSDRSEAEAAVAVDYLAMLYGTAEAITGRAKHPGHYARVTADRIKRDAAPQLAAMVRDGVDADPVAALGYLGVSPVTAGYAVEQLAHYQALAKVPA